MHRHHRHFSCTSPHILASACLLSVLAVCGCGKSDNKPAEKAPIEVTALTVARQDTPVSFVQVAQTQSSQAVNIVARVSGFLDKRVYVEGSVVKAGQVLFLMDQKPFVAQVDAQKAALARSQASLEVAKANLARTKPLAEQNALSQKDLDDAQGNYDSAAAAVEQGKAQLQEAELNLSYTTITSPVNGVSSFAAVADGTYLNPQNSQLTTVSVLTPMWINFSLSENDMERLRDEVQRGLLKLPDKGEFVVEIELVDGSLFPYTGRITFANPSYNPQTGTFLIRATVDNPAGVLRPSQYVRVRLKGAIRPNSIIVPQRAVQQGAKGHFVWVVNKEDQAELRPITVGEWYGDGWFITDGLEAGDRVVVEGGLRLAQGVKVHASAYTPPATPAVSSRPSAASKSAGAPTAGQRAADALADVAVYFARGQAVLDDAAMQVIRTKAAQVMGGGTRIIITGYTDSTGGHETNVDLAKRRAVAVRDALVQLGVQPQRIRLQAPENVTGIGRDDQARRVDIEVSH
jgi:membrane fusion protein (multidrug efflux system)